MEDKGKLKTNFFVQQAFLDDKINFIELCKVSIASYGNQQFFIFDYFI